MKAVYGDLVLHGADIDTLNPGEWLNDQVLEFALRWLSERSNSDLTVVPPATTQLCLHAPTVAPSVAHDLRLDPARAPGVLFCVNNAADLTRPLAGSHWSALVAVRTAGSSSCRYIHYDSIGVNNRVAEDLANVLSGCPGFQGSERPPAVEHDRSFRGRQQNDSDCGVFVAAVARAYMDVDMRGSEEGGWEEAVGARLAEISSSSVMELRGELLKALLSHSGLS